MFTKVIVFALPPVESVDDWIIVELETHVSLSFFANFLHGVNLHVQLLDVIKSNCTTGLIGFYHGTLI